MMMWWHTDDTPGEILLIMSFEAELDKVLLSSCDNIGFRCYQNMLVR